jgi:hypothetical protein
MTVVDACVIIKWWMQDPERKAGYGRFATTLPFSQTYTGVPYIRAIRRAARSARIRARPTLAANFGFLFRFSLERLAFMVRTL